MNKLDDNGCQELVKAIVLLAVDDWRRANLASFKLNDSSFGVLREKRSCEKFFLSPWFEMLTGFEGSCFLRSLKKGYSF